MTCLAARGPRVRWPVESKVELPTVTRLGLGEELEQMRLEVRDRRRVEADEVSNTVE